MLERFLNSAVLHAGLQSGLRLSHQVLLVCVFIRTSSLCVYSFKMCVKWKTEYFTYRLVFLNDHYNYYSSTVAVFAWSMSYNPL